MGEVIWEASDANGYDVVLTSLYGEEGWQLTVTGSSDWGYPLVDLTYDDLSRLNARLTAELLKRDVRRMGLNRQANKNVPVYHNGEVVGTADVDEDGEMHLTSVDRHILDLIVKYGDKVVGKADILPGGEVRATLTSEFAADISPIVQSMEHMSIGFNHNRFSVLEEIRRGEHPFAGRSVWRADSTPRDSKDERGSVEGS